MEVTYAVFITGNMDKLKEVLANKEIGLLTSFLNNFKTLFGMVAGPNV